MTGTVRLLALSGSLRTGSFNRRVVDIAAASARAAGADVEAVDLRDFPLPHYDADLERSEGVPERALALKDLFCGADGYLVAAPEYNGSIPGVLKNAFDWISRPGDGETPMTLRAFRGKVAGVMSASPGPWGGIRGLSHLRQILSGMYVLVVAEQLAVPDAASAFAEDGKLKNPAYQGILEIIGRRTAQFARVMKDG